jgi:peroxiredoxin
MPLQVGDTAPEFTLRDGTGRGEISLGDFAGRPVVLAFYALAFTGG